MDVNDKLWLLEANPDPSLSMYSPFQSWQEVIGTSDPVNDGVKNKKFNCVFSKQKSQALSKLKKVLLK